jgi:hypothetical protein
MCAKKFSKRDNAFTFVRGDLDYYHRLVLSTKVSVLRIRREVFKVVNDYRNDLTFGRGDI